MSKRSYLDLADGSQTHVRRHGNGRPLVLLHPSPLSSKWLEPVLQILPGDVEGIAADTPGYGASDPLPETAGAGLDGYVAWLRELVAALGERRVGLYGSATGAQIAIEFARAWPDMTRFLVLDNVAHFTSEERAAMLERYFPDLSPRPDGSHLQTAWEMVSALWQWFPWYQQDEAHQVGTAGKLPAEALQSMLLDHFRAGPGYSRAYRAALENEDANRLLGVTVPTRVIRWQGSILRKYADRYDDFSWPTHIGMRHCAAPMEQRLAAIHAAVVELNQAKPG